MTNLNEEIKTILDFLVDSVPDNQIPKVDAIFVFGHQQVLHLGDIDKRVPQKAAKLFFSGKAEKIVVTGHKSEAERFASLIKDEGVPQEVLVLENNSSNTLENVLLGVQVCCHNGLTPKSLVLVALPPHLRRARATFAKQFPSIRTFGSSFPLEPNEVTSVRRIKRVTEEINRLQQYATKGDIEPVVIPPEVATAYTSINLFLSERFT